MAVLAAKYSRLSEEVLRAGLDKAGVAHSAGAGKEELAALLARSRARDPRFAPPSTSTAAAAAAGGGGGASSSSVPAPSLHELYTCHRAGCGATFGHVLSDFDTGCAFCRAARYCTPACQLADWEAHRAGCMVASRARVDAGDGRIDDLGPQLQYDMEQAKIVHGEDADVTLRAVSDFAVLLQRQGKLRESEPLVRDVLTRRLRLVGGAHLSTHAA